MANKKTCKKNIKVFPGATIYQYISPELSINFGWFLIKGTVLFVSFS